MALLNRFSKLNDRGETGIFTFIVTKSVTRDFHRDATTKDFCFGYHRWAISFQRPTEKVLGVHLLLRNPSPNTACVVDFTLTLLNREHFSQNEVYTKRQAKFTITNPMQGVSRWIQMSDLIEKHFSNETGEFLFELSLSNMTTIFECDIQLNPTTLTQYKGMLKNGFLPNQQQQQQHGSAAQAAGSTAASNSSSADNSSGARHSVSAAGKQQQANQRNESSLINLETNYFTFGAFDWSLTIVPLVTPSQQQVHQHQQQQNDSSTSSSSSNNNLLGPYKQQLNCPKKSVQLGQAPGLEPVCRVYLNRLNGFDCLCRVRYRVILGHHQPSGQHTAEFVDSKMLDQISDIGGRIRGHQFRNTNILKLISLRSSGQQASLSASGATNSNSMAGIAAQAAASYHHSASTNSSTAKHHHHSQQQQHQHHNHHQAAASLDLRVHIEMFCANTISEARVPLQCKPNEAQVSNCSDRNKQAWCVESDSENDNVRLKLFFMDLQSVPRNHIRYISWIAYIVRRDTKSGALKESIAVRNSPHSNYYLQDGIDMGTIMDTDIPVKELNNAPRTYLDSNQLTVHIEWVDSLLLFSHLYNNYDSLATIQRHQIRRELCALQQEFEHLERKCAQNKRALELALGGQGQQQRRTSDLYSPSSPPSSSSLSLISTGGLAQEQQAPPPPQSAGGRARADSRADAMQIGEVGQQQQQQQQQQSQFGANSSTSGNSSNNNNGGSKKQLVEQHRPQPIQLAGSAADSQQWGASERQQQQQQQQQQRAAPMSHDERLKFSSSTPPGPTTTGAPATTTAFQQQQLHQHHQGQPSPQHQLRETGSALTQSIRRRLPQQPPTTASKLLQHPQQANVVVVAAANHHQIDRRNSQLPYQQLSGSSRPSLEQQQAIRGVGAGELGAVVGNFERAPSPIGDLVGVGLAGGRANSTAAMFAPSGALPIEPSPINELHQASCHLVDVHGSGGGGSSASDVSSMSPTLNMLMKENQQQQQLISQVEAEQQQQQASELYHRGQLNSGLHQQRRPNPHQQQQPFLHSSSPAIGGQRVQLAPTSSAASVSAVGNYLHDDKISVSLLASGGGGDLSADGYPIFADSLTIADKQQLEFVAEQQTELLVTDRRHHQQQQLHHQHQHQQQHQHQHQHQHQQHQSTLTDCHSSAAIELEMELAALYLGHQNRPSLQQEQLISIGTAAGRHSDVHNFINYSQELASAGERSRRQSGASSPPPSSLTYGNVGPPSSSVAGAAKLAPSGQQHAHSPSQSHLVYGPTAARQTPQPPLSLQAPTGLASTSANGANGSFFMDAISRRQSAASANNFMADQFGQRQHFESRYTSRL